MDQRPPLSASDYWYLGSPDPEADQLFRHVCTLAWPYALYCATRFQHDPQIAYELMDAAVENAERYYERFNRQRSSIQLFYRISSVIRRLSKHRANSKREIPRGSLSDLEELAQRYSDGSEAEQAAFVRQVLEKMSERSCQIAYWRLAGHSWRQIAEELGSNHITVRRVFHTEIRGLLFLSSGTDSFGGREDSDQDADF
jgi:hypothetical protein